MSPICIGCFFLLIVYQMKIDVTSIAHSVLMKTGNMIGMNIAPMIEGSLDTFIN